MAIVDRVKFSIKSLLGLPNKAQLEITESSPHVKLDLIKEKQIKKDPIITPTTGGRKTQPTFNEQAYPHIDKNLIFVKPEFSYQAICTIRQLTKSNPDFGMALNNVVSLANTGIRLFFDKSVNDIAADKMRAHIDKKLLHWADKNYTTPSELISKMFKQLMVAGAIANEWVPSNDLKTIDNIFFIHPEEIEFAYDSKKGYYIPYQHTKADFLGLIKSKHRADSNLIKLDTKTFKYYGLASDTESPYGIPPFLNALEPLDTDYNMLDNIKWIVEQIGIWGFLEVLMEKPDFKDGQSISKYTSEMEQFLAQTKARVQAGYRDGITVGFKDDTEFKFHSTTKESSSVREIYSLNWQRVIRGLKSDPALFGGDDSRSETQITIVFTKMLSELAHYQNVVKTNLEFGIRQELLMQGFNFNKLTLQFNPSTLQDALKFEQAREIKIRNNNALYYDGIIDLKHYANDLGLEASSEKEPRIIRGVGNIKDPSQEAKDKQDREKDKDKSDKKVADKNKPQGNLKR